jgi:hypothetical protein
MPKVFLYVELHNPMMAHDVREEIVQALDKRGIAWDIDTFHPYCVECIEEEATHFQKLDDCCDAPMCDACYAKRVQ